MELNNVLSRSDSSDLNAREATINNNNAEALLQSKAASIRRRNCGSEADQASTSSSMDTEPLPIKGGHKAKGKHGSNGLRKGGRPVTWIGGGGLDARKLGSLGVPQLRALFLEVFGQHTASNNATWLRRKLAEPPDATYGRGRSALVRARDVGAAIWTTGSIRNITKAEEDLGPTPSPSPKLIHVAGGSAGGSGSMSDDLSSQTQDLPNNGGGAVTSGDGQEGEGSPWCGQDGGSSLPASPTAAAAAAALRKRPHRRSEVARLLQGAPTADTGEIRRSKRVHHPGPSPTASPHVAPKTSHPSHTTLSIETVGPHLVGAGVQVYWPDDNTWWPATITRINVSLLKMLLQYDNGESETISGIDFLDMLRRGHVAATGAVAPAQPCRSAGSSGNGGWEGAEAELRSSGSTGGGGDFEEGQASRPVLRGMMEARRAQDADAMEAATGMESGCSDDPEEMPTGLLMMQDAPATHMLLQDGGCTPLQLKVESTGVEEVDMGAELDLLGGRDWQNYPDPLQLGNWPPEGTDADADDLCEDWMAPLGQAPTPLPPRIATPTPTLHLPLTTSAPVAAPQPPLSNAPQLSAPLPSLQPPTLRPPTLPFSSMPQQPPLQQAALMQPMPSMSLPMLQQYAQAMQAVQAVQAAQQQQQQQGGNLAMQQPCSMSMQQACSMSMQQPCSMPPMAMPLMPPCPLPPMPPHLQQQQQAGPRDATQPQMSVDPATAEAWRQQHQDNAMLLMKQQQLWQQQMQVYVAGQEMAAGGGLRQPMPGPQGGNIYAPFFPAPPQAVYGNSSRPYLEVRGRS